MYIGKLNVDTEQLLDQIDSDDLIMYLYKKKIISYQAVKKALNIKSISEAPSLSYFTDIDFDDLNFDTEDFLRSMSDDDIYDYLLSIGYDFPEPEFPEDPEPWWDNNHFIEVIKSAFNRRYGKTWSREELKKQINEAIDWYSTEAKGDS